MKPEAEQELAHILLVELLAHQFTFPVRWIETQDVLLMEQGVERLIEIGPAPTLRNMAQRTMDGLYDGCDPLLKNREFLSATKDADRVYYRIEPTMEEVVAPVQEDISIQKEPLATSQAIEVSPRMATAIPIIADIPLTAKHIVTTMIAMKLKKPVTEIDTAATIKKLAGGRSTMENEIVGDLLAEFKNLPDRTEELPIQALYDELEAGFSHKLGPFTSSQIARLFSNRMPGGFTIETAKDYLKTTWGISGDRQQMILLEAIKSLPASRLKTYESTESYLDELVNQHAVATGATISKGKSSTTDLQSTAVDPAILRDLETTRRELSQKQLQTYADDLGIDLKAGEKKAAATQVALDEALGELDLWNAEHGSVYAAGIKPMMQVSKARNYQSWTEWAAQDVTILFSKIATGEVLRRQQEHITRELHIANCATPQLLERLRVLVDVVEKEFPASASIPDLESLLGLCQRSIMTPPVYRSIHTDVMPVNKMDETGNVVVTEVSRRPAEKVLSTPHGKDNLPHVASKPHLDFPSIALKSHDDFVWKPDEDLSTAYIRVIHDLRNSGITFENKKVLITGAGPNSIGAEILKGLLAGGAQVVCTTSRYSADTAESFRYIYATHGGKGSRLVILPFNQASHQDIEALVSYVYTESGLAWDLDLVLPFAAVPEADRDIDQIDAKSELAHRAMLTNTIRLLGSVKRQKEIQGIDTRPAHVILPLSSNHGMIGRDGLYAESKLALEGTLHKWHSEEWSPYLSLCGAEIGWTRGTGLMSSNAIVAEEVERLGVRTFSCDEMAANLLALCSSEIVQFCHKEPLIADLNGGLDKVKNLGAKLKRIRGDMQEAKANLRAIYDEKRHDTAMTHGSDTNSKAALSKSVNGAIELSTLPTINYETQVAPLAEQLKGMVDLDRVAVITGFAELGSLGSARTRMQMEFKNGFTSAGCVELAWLLGYIKKGTSAIEATCWIDGESGQPVLEAEIKHKYEERILQNTGIRLVKSESSEQQMLQEIVLQADLAPITTTAQGAIEYARIHGQNANIWQEGSTDEWHVVLKAGATMMVPKARSITSTAVGQLPTGWNPKIYGIDETIIGQVDKITLYSLVATVEALLSSGIPDFYSLYKHIHTSEVANCLGSGQGGMTSLRGLFRDRYTDQTVQNDILQETFANTTGAWINMLLLGASGPIRTPVGACATALESLDSAAELIAAGKAKLALVGGVDDWSPEVSAEFGNMRATVDTAAQESSGREPKEFSRPMATTRGGFVEAQGAGVQVVTSARLALDLGLPIHGIVAFTGLASDKPGRSVPAPGKGLLNFAAAAQKSEFPSPMLNISYRRKLLERKLAQIEASRLAEIEDLALEAEMLPASERSSFLCTRHQQILLEASLSRTLTIRSLTNTFHTSNPNISPLSGALSVWGLTANSISVLCMHGTSTSKGDTNEAQVLNTQLTHLGRDPKTVQPAIAVCSKWLTGHGKGAAGAWSLNTALQILATGIVPRNGNLDDLSPELQGLENITFLGGRGAGIKMAKDVDVISVSAFGFGQKGAQALIVHPRFLFATLEGGKEEFEGYWGKMNARRRVARRELADGIWEGNLVGKRIQSEGVWVGKADEVDVLLDRGWRA